MCQKMLQIIILLSIILVFTIPVCAEQREFHVNLSMMNDSNQTTVMMDGIKYIKVAETPPLSEIISTIVEIPVYNSLSSVSSVNIVIALGFVFVIILVGFFILNQNQS